MTKDILINRNDMVDLLAGRRVHAGPAILVRDQFTDDQILNLGRGEWVKIEIDGATYNIRTSY